MNEDANELADLFGTTDMPSDWGCQAQAMLRKQQEEIQYWKTAFEKAMEIRTK